jgi:hypothetical protein
LFEIQYVDGASFSRLSAVVVQDVKDTPVSRRHIAEKLIGVGSCLKSEE